MEVESQLLRLVASIYEAAENPEQWTDVLNQFSALVRAVQPVFSFFDPSRREGGVSVSQQDPAYIASYEAHYYKINVHLQDIPFDLTPGLVAHGRMIRPDKYVLRSEFYNDYLRPQDMFHMLGGVIAMDRSLCSLITAYRPVTAAPFEEAELEILRTLVPHLARASRLHQRLHSLDLGMAALNALAIGVVAVTATGHVCLLNKTAEEVLAANDGLCIDRTGGIVGSTPGDLAAAIRVAAEVSAASSLSLPENIKVFRPSGKLPYTVAVSPVRSSRLRIKAERAAAVLFILDSERRGRFDEAALRARFGLTAAESRVAMILMSGRDVGEVCQSLRIMRTTVRTHLRNIYRKTGVRRQGELVALLVRTLGTFRTQES